MIHRALRPLDGAWRDPADVFLGVAAAHTDAFWLDAGSGADSGWSWVGWGVPEDAGVVRATVCAGPARVPREPSFTGGWVGWVGYETGTAAAGVGGGGCDAGVPDELWLRPKGLVAFDHRARRLWAAGDIDARARGPRPPAPSPAAAHARHGPAQYEAMIARCREAIRAGDAYQLCLTTRFDVDGTVDPIAAYLALRESSPAHHGAIIRTARAALLSASPERFLEVDGDTVRTHPIKGTRPRGADPAADAALAAELAASPKERAENVMIVDLMRNDLARVCRPATVHVERLLAVESYPAVHQLVSTVAGSLAPGTTVDALLAAAFPAGSMTGAPKLSAMGILQRIEQAPRGVFAGCFGWVGAGGGLDLAMVIRSVVVHRAGAYVGAGGGITWLSEPAAEVAEVGIKARAPLAALGAGLPAGW